MSDEAATVDESDRLCAKCERTWPARSDQGVSVGFSGLAAEDLKRTEALLEDRAPSPALADEAAAVVAAEITPIDDIRSTAAYRRELDAYAGCPTH